ncbi:MAG: CsgG/HfaB family protein [Fibrobacterota bacterium]
MKFLYPLFCIFSVMFVFCSPPSSGSGNKEIVVESGKLIYQKELQKAETLLKQYLKDNNRGGYALGMLSLVNYLKGEKKAAFSSARRSIRIDGNFSVPHFVLSALSKEKGRTRFAARHFERGKSLIKSEQERRFLKLINRTSQKSALPPKKMVSPSAVVSEKEELMINDGKAPDSLKPSIAVFIFKDVNRASEEEGLGRSFSEMLTTSMIKAGFFSVIERSQLDKILNEQSLGQSGIIEGETAVEVGKVLGVDGVVIGSISKYDDSVEGDVRIIDVRTGKALGAGSGGVYTVKEMRSLADRFANTLSKYSETL